MSRITGISKPHWDHRATQETTTGTAAAGTGEAARDRHRALKAGSFQLPDNGGTGDFGGRWGPISNQLLLWYRVFHENKTDFVLSFLFAIRPQTLPDSPCKMKAKNTPLRAMWETSAFVPEQWRLFKSQTHSGC